MKNHRVTKPSPPRRITILGSTGSIGRSTLDILENYNEPFEVVALTGQANVALLAEQAIKLRAKVAVIGDENMYTDLKAALAGTSVEAAAGAAAITDAASRPVDWTMAAIVGAAGLRPTLEAVRQGRTVALANKECLVCAGALFMAEVAASGATLLPVDSEHSAVFQALDNTACVGVEKIVLTASGGPFRNLTALELKSVTPQMALRHPNWSMGPKITIDSATMMNKGLEIIEAFHLFHVEAHQLEVVVHPQSIVHALVHYCDGSVLAQLSSPDMRTPIALSLAWPSRMNTPVKRLDLTAIGGLTFEAPDETRFPALRIARHALLEGGSAPVILNAANEVAVAAFLDGMLDFNGIPALVEKTLERSSDGGDREPESVDAVLAADTEARRVALEILAPITAAMAAA
ncbi:MAG: 1-deoxy-D-xylulose-5-phosphate reductoisomerase [Hyphomicrobiales bacterium]|nr:1-deoxy-D-xylulose-5-phosphate reductoisomerase [Hyphomicrobiales bacterium]